MRIPILFLAIITVYCCKPKDDFGQYLGVVKIEVSGKAKAIPYFEKGLLLLHSFEYEDAREAFRKAQEKDPNMPMAYWGEAMTFNHTLWSEQDYESASAALEKLMAFDYKANSTELEQDFIKAVQILYQPKTEKIKRDQAYALFMAELAEKYPDNHEVAAFYAVSLLGSVPDGRDVTLYGKGAKIAQGILEENPNHPGALHYLIHSYDDPEHANLALDAARAYSKVAPDASHALHMPSHIFVAMGMWDDVIASNIHSYEASVARMKEKNLDNDARGYHAYHWLEYGYLQNDQKQEAEKMVLLMQQYAEETPSKRARVHLVFLKGTYLVETNDWNSEIANIPVDISDLSISIRSQFHFLEGMKAYVNGNKKVLDSIIAIMENDHNRDSFVIAEGKSKLCANVDRGEITQTDLTEALARQYQLMGLRADMDQNLQEAEAHFKKSVELESSISYSFGPPNIQKPTQELYADWLLKEGRMQEAREHYELALKMAPKRRLILQGITNTESEVQ